MRTRYVYLLHLSRPFGHARHYLGSALNVEARVELHRAGQGARFTQVVVGAGIELQLVRTWDTGTDAGRRLERNLKRRGSRVRLCPLCNPRRAKASARRRK